MAMLLEAHSTKEKCKRGRNRAKLWKSGDCKGLRKAFLKVAA
jgi:hypothetical protein